MGGLEAGEIHRERIERLGHRRASLESPDEREGTLVQGVALGRIPVHPGGVSTRRA